MNYLHIVKFEQVWEHAEIDWRKGLPDAVSSLPIAVWKITTSVNDRNHKLSESKFFKSVKDECNDDLKRSSLLVMLNQLGNAIGQDDYQSFLKTSSAKVKEALSFEYSGKSHKIWELKSGKKDRIYFFSHRHLKDGKALNIINLLRFHHKKDDATPKDIRAFCEKSMKPFLGSKVDIEILKENL